MAPELKELLSNSLTLIIFVLPVVSLFWKLARYSTTMEQQLKQKDEKIASLENRLSTVENKNINSYKEINTNLEHIKELTSLSNTACVKHDRDIEEHSTRINKLEERAEELAKTLSDIKAENSKQTAMLDILVKRIGNEK